MNWYWVVLLVFTYVFIGALMFSILCRDDENKDIEPLFAVASVLWPVVIVSLPLAIIVWAADKLVGKFYKRKEE